MKKIFLLLGVVFTNIFQVAQGQVNVDVLVVGGGGGGGFRHGGGGGAGGLKYVQNQSINHGQSYTITVGAGGTGFTSQIAGSSTNDGKSSSFGNLISVTGGGGGGSNTHVGRNGGSGGGGSNGTNGGSGISGEGNKGGNQNNGSGCCHPYGAGGGGAGAAGQNTTGSVGSNGGVGVEINITGISMFYAGGGGAGHEIANLAAYTGGNGGGGNGGTRDPLNGANGVANTGGGGGGGGAIGTTSGNGGNGGSGVVIIRYPSNAPLATGGDITSYTANGSNGTNGVVYQVHTFRSSGTFVFTGIITTQPSSLTQNICLGGTPNNLSVSVTGSSQTHQWYSNTTASNTGGTLITGQTSASFTPPTSATGTRYYYCVVSAVNNGITTTQSSNVSGAIVVSNPFIPGNISGANTVTSGTNSTQLRLNGSIGTILWQESTDDITFSTLSGQTATTYTATNLTATRYYRALVSVSGCTQTATASAAVVVLPATTALSTSLNISGTNTATTAISIPINTHTVVDPNLTVTASGAIRGFSVTISQNYANGDVLDYTGTLPSGVTASSFNTQSRSLVFNGSATASEWQALLRTVRLRSTSATCTPERRVVTFSVSSLYYNYFNGHFYEYVPTGRVWTDAKAFAASKTFFGMQGYLAVISTAEENAYISTLIGQNSWLGATDNFEEINQAVGYKKYANQSAAEGNYHWVTGPEKGRPFSQSSVYKRWQSGEPNNFNTGFYDKITKSYGEHYLHIYSDRKTWNDFPNDRRLGSIIEYGGMPGDDPIGTVSFDVNIIVQGMAGGTITGGRDTVCSTTNTLNLSLSGHTGSVSKWQYSNDNFFTDIHDISNNTNTLGVANLTETRFFRAIVVNGSCELATASRFRAVIPAIPGSITSVNNEICPGGSITLQAANFSGTVNKWQITSGNINSNPSTTDISSTSSSLTHTISSAGNYHIRAVYNYCSTTHNSEWYPVSVIASSTPIGGRVTSEAHCGSSNTGTLQLTGASGSSFQWQKSSDGGNTWSNESSTKTSLNYHNIATNTLFRVVVSAGACGSAISDMGEVQIYGTSKSLWTGNQNSAWNNPNNWCAGVVGSNGKNVVISPEALNNAALNSDLHLASLDFNASGRKVILGNHHLRTDLLLGTDSLNFIQTNGTGTLRRSIAHTDSFLFGVGTTSYNPVQITNKTGSSDEFSVSVFDGVYEKGFKGQGRALQNVRRVDKTWEISKSNPTANSGDGVDFVFEWEVEHRKNLSTDVTRLTHFSSTLDAWEFANNTGAQRGEYYLKVMGYKGSFSPFAIGEDNLTPLPVLFQSFQAKTANNVVNLDWATHSEENTDRFSIERAENGLDFFPIGEVRAQGNSFTTANYAFVDDAPLPSNYYRLKVVDKDGSFYYSAIKWVAFTTTKTKPLSVYPNPSTGSVSIQTQGATQLVLSDMLGRKLENIAFDKEYTLHNLSKGIYLLQIHQGEEISYHKIVVE